MLQMDNLSFSELNPLPPDLPHRGKATLPLNTVGTVPFLHSSFHPFFLPPTRLLSPKGQRSSPDVTLTSQVASSPKAVSHGLKLDLRSGSGHCGQHGNSAGRHMCSQDMPQKK